MKRNKRYEMRNKREEDCLIKTESAEREIFKAIWFC